MFAPPPVSKAPSTHDPRTKIRRLFSALQGCYWAMPDIEIILLRYDQASSVHAEVCRANPSGWHKADCAEFRELLGLLTPLAEAGDLRSQYAVATIHWL